MSNIPPGLKGLIHCPVPVFPEYHRKWPKAWAGKFDSENEETVEWEGRAGGWNSPDSRIYYADTPFIAGNPKVTAV